MNSNLNFADFDAETYLMFNPDVAQSGMDALYHYINYGQREGRKYRSNSGTQRRAWSIIEDSGLFDAAWYTAAYSDVLGSGKSAIAHFCEIGIREQRDPSLSFSSEWYSKQNPDVKGMNPLLHYIEYGRAEGRLPIPPGNALATAIKVYDNVKDLDVGLSSSMAFSDFMAVPFVNNVQRPGKMKQALLEIISKISGACTHFIFVPWCIHSGADRVALNIAKLALSEIGPQRVAYMIVDYDKFSAVNWVPKGLNVVNFASACKELDPTEKCLVLEKLIQIYRPEKCLNVNSGIAWTLFRSRGGIISENYSSLYACLFCSAYDSEGRAVGYADTHFRDAIVSLTKVYCDNMTFVETLINRYGLLENDRQKLEVIRQPVQNNSAQAKKVWPRSGGELDVLWAGRICRQKNFRLLAAIAAAVPQGFRFHIWGHGNDNDIRDFAQLTKGLTNLNYYGPFESFSNLPHESYNAFLYTSIWDGMPNVVLEAAATGYPIVASGIGGIPELIDLTTGWIVSSSDEIQGYVAALNVIKRDSQLAQKRGALIRERTLSEYRWEHFAAVLCSEGGFVNEN